MNKLNSRITANIDTFNGVRLDAEIDKAHRVAINSEKIGQKLVDKTVTLIEKGKSTTRVPSPRLALGLADYESTTLALNAALKEEGLPVVAKVYADSYNEGGSHYTRLAIKEISGEPIPDTRYPVIDQ